MMQGATLGEFDGSARKSLGGPWGRLFGWLRLGPDYLASVSTDEVVGRAFAPRAAAEYRARQRDTAEALDGLLRRAEAHARIASRRYRDSIQADAIKGVLTRERELEIERENLLLGRPTPRVDESSIHTRKTPVTGLVPRDQ